MADPQISPAVADQPRQGRFSRTWSIAKISWHVIKQTRSLVVIPVVSAITCAVLVAALSIPLLPAVDSSDEGSYRGLAIILGIIALFGTSVITIFFSAAIVAGAYQYFSGEQPTLGSSLGGAIRRFPRILGWALVTTVVSAILQFIEQKLGFIGDLISGILGVAWRVATFLVIPVLVIEDAGPIKSLKRSGHLLRQTWGENIIGQAGFGLIGLVLLLPAIGVGVIASATNSDVIAIAGIAVAVVWAVVVISVLSAMSKVYQTALYLYAVNGSAPEVFAGTDMAHAFRPRLRRRGAGV